MLFQILENLAELRTDFELGCTVIDMKCKLQAVISACSQHPLIQTFNGPNITFELANVWILEKCYKSNSRPSEWKKNTRKCPFVPFLQGKQ